jgi:hypothetical protein
MHPTSLAVRKMDMRYTQRLVMELSIRGDPLVRSILEIEIPELIDNLRQKLELSQIELDLSPKSLSILSRGLLSYYQFFKQQDHISLEEETIKIVREITAYFGDVILKNFGGEWLTVGSLQDTAIEFEGRTETIKGNEIRSYSRRIILIGPVAIGTWDAVLLGIEPNLYEGYQKLTAIRVKEDLKIDQQSGNRTT